MSYAYTALKDKIRKAGEGDERYTLQALEEQVYDKYKNDKLTAEEYNELCTLLEFMF